MHINHQLTAIVGSLAMLLCSCSQRPTDVAKVSEAAPIYPDYAGVTIPAGIAPLDFNVVADGLQRVDVTVTGNKGGTLHSCGDYARWDTDDWHRLTEQNRGDTLTFTVCAKIQGKWLQYPDFHIYVSTYPLDEWGVTYRRIAPGYEVYSSMGIYQRDLANFDEYPIIENTETSGQCYNCHTSNRTDPEAYVMHVRGEHGATMVQHCGKRKWLKAVNDSLRGALVYPYWHPSGRYCAFSTNQTRQGFHVAGDKRLEVFDLSSDVLIYDVETNQIILDTLLTSKTWSENIPAFSPDGKTLYFTTCLQRSYPLEHKQQRYNLCRVDFDPECGKIGSRVDTIFNAEVLGKSVTWPRPSYDGRFILFSLIDYGYFSVWHSEADQWLLDLATGEARPLDELNSSDADSYHAWSANSRWIVFTSRRDDGLYTRLYLAEVDPEGNVTKPFLLPQRDPLTYYRNSLYSYNTPDFTARKVDFDATAAAAEILGGERTPTQIR